MERLKTNWLVESDQVLARSAKQAAELYAAKHTELSVVRVRKDDLCYSFSITHVCKGKGSGASVPRAEFLFFDGGKKR